MKIGDTVTYWPGAVDAVDATVTAINEDGTVNITYPHPADASVAATADNCQVGTGAFMVAEKPEPEAKAKK